MCFRPADANMSVTCPSCGKEINAVLGIVPKECPFCGATSEDFEGASDIKAPSAPAAPGAPKAPGAPQPPAAHGRS